MEIHLVSVRSRQTTSGAWRRQCWLPSAASLDRLPVTYSVRVETATGNSIQHNRTAAASDGYVPEDALEDGAEDPAVRHGLAGGPLAILDRD